MLFISIVVIINYLIPVACQTIFLHQKLNKIFDKTLCTLYKIMVINYQ